MTLEEKLLIALQALRKIDDPKKYHHLEPDSYTQAACFQFVAYEARIKLGDLPEAGNES